MFNKDIKIKNTLGMFDLYKGVIMVSILLSHCYGIFDNRDVFMTIAVVIFSLVGTACLPALFIMSGYGFRKTTFKKCVRHQFKSIMIPYCITVVLTCIVHLIAYFELYGGGVKSTIKETIKLALGSLLGLSDSLAIFGYEIPANRVAWFLVALFVGSVVFNQFLNYFEGEKLFAACVIASIIGWIISKGPTTPWCISQGLVATLYMCIGYFAKKKKYFIADISKKISISVTLICALVFLATLALGAEFNMALSYYPYGPVYIFLMALVAVANIYWFLRLNRAKGLITTSLRSIGRNSLYVLLIHNIELTAVGVYLQYDFVNNWQGPVWLRNLIVIGVRFIVVFGLTYIFVWAKSNIFSKVRFGNSSR